MLGIRQETRPQHPAPGQRPAGGQHLCAERVGMVEAAVDLGRGHAEGVGRRTEPRQDRPRIHVIAPFAVRLGGRKLTKSLGPAVFLPEMGLVARIPLRREIRPELGQKDQDIGVAHAPGGTQSLARVRIDAEGRQAKRIQHVTLEGAPRPFNLHAVIGPQQPIGPLDTGPHGQDIDRVAFAGIVVQHAVARAVQVVCQRRGLVEQDVTVTRVAGQVLIAGQPRNDERTEERVLTMHVVVTPVRAHPGVMHRIHHQIHTGLNRFGRVNRRSRVRAALATLPGCLQIFRSPEIVDRPEDRPLRGRHVVQVQLTGRS